MPDDGKIFFTESARLAELDGYRIMDTLADESFDELTRLVAEIFDTPIALVSLVDDHRQWFKSKYGLTASETPKNIAFCAHAIQSSELFVVEDALKDERFRDNPLVQGWPFVRFYAGAPLETPRGYRLGTLCVIDTKARVPEPKQLRVLKILSNQVVMHMERLRVQRDRDEYHALVEAQRLQIAESSKLAALGEMASGIAHEINNPLAIIQAKVALLARFSLEPKVDASNLARVSKQLDDLAERIAKIVRGLRNFARDGQRDKVEDFSPNDLVHETLSFCKERIRDRGIVLELAVDARPELKLKGRSVQISQILLNLLNNAYDATETDAHPFIKVELIEREKTVDLAVINTGPAITENIRKKIFEPFFTTKKVGKGTGLGLSVSSGLAESNGGRLYLDESSLRTRFVISLPKAG